MKSIEERKKGEERRENRRLPQSLGKKSSKHQAWKVLGKMSSGHQAQWIIGTESGCRDRPDQPGKGRRGKQGAIGGPALWFPLEMFRKLLSEMTIKTF